MSNGTENPILNAIASDASVDIESLVLLVMEQAVADANADLREMMEELRRRHERLARLRKALAALTAWREANASAESELLGSVRDLAGDLLKNTTDLTELMQMRLQMMMDRRSKLFEALSNLMKKQSDTASGIIKNLK